MNWLRKSAEALLANPLYAASFAALCMFVPFMAWLAWGWIVLASLRYGLRYCIYVTLGATLGVIVLVGLLEGVWSLAWINIFVFIIPLACFAMVLRQSVSLNFTVQTVFIALLITLVIVDYLQIMSPASIAAFFKCRLEQVIATDPTVGQSIDTFAEQFAWSWPTALFWVYIFGLFLGRWWQAALDNPGGFKREFNALRLNYWVGSAAFLLIVISFFLPQSVLLIGSVGLAMNLLMLCGLGFVQNWVNAKSLSGWWLVGLYALLLVVPIIALPILSTLAAVDSVADLRGRYLQKQ